MVPLKAFLSGSAPNLSYQCWLIHEFGFVCFLHLLCLAIISFKKTGLGGLHAMLTISADTDVTWKIADGQDRLE